MNKQKRKLVHTVFVLAAVAALFISGYVTNRKIAISTACPSPNGTGEIDFSQKYAFFEGREIEIPKMAMEKSKTPVLGASSGNKWIEIDLSDQKIKTWDGDSLFLESLISTGLPWFPTPQGEFRIWAKLRATKMEGGTGKYYYYLPNVPFVMFFENEKVPSWRGYGLHGTYWHNDFGKVHSHGCINLPTSVAQQLYNWTDPQMLDGKWIVRATEENPGTRIVIHE
ncbi:MAG: L,D-transpeptidase [bacterium]